MNLLPPVAPVLLCLALACASAQGQTAGPAAGATPGATPGPTPGETTGAAAKAGTVKRIAGLVTLERAGSRSPAVVGAAVLVGDTLRTGADGAVGITLADDTLLSLGADSELVLDSFSFDTTTHDGGLLVSLWRGTVGVVTGLIGRKAPEKLRFQTRTVVLGVRGTEFIIDASGVAR